ncbi:MAG TPA: hypothetical protein VL282_18565 [Tepidisphaeraceae bacterium]|jgi:hypothetical protein|nr:hypothetical protein [Tepidisphaeraceae bacterium]
MKSTILWVLVAVNAVLLMTLIGKHTQENAAYGQAAAPAVPRRPGEYLMIPGDVTSLGTGVVYILDTTNGWLGAMSYEDSSHQLGVMPKIDLGKTLAEAGVTGPQKKTGGGAYNR